MARKVLVLSDDVRDEALVGRALGPSCRVQRIMDPGCELAVVGNRSLAADLRARHPGLPILLLVPASEEAHALEIVSRTVDDYVLRGPGAETRLSAAAEAVWRRGQAGEAAVELARLKSEFVANVSHEIRTPLNSLVGLAGLLGDTELSTEQAEYVEGLQQSGRKLTRLVDDLLDFASLEAGLLRLSPAPFQLRAWLSETADPVRERCERKGLRFSVDVGRDVPDELTGDSRRMRQILAQLLDNAVKFTDSGGVAVSVSAEPTALRFAVSDTGPGIAADRHAMVFDAFTQLHGSSTRRHGGVGLGLALCRRLARLMDGDLALISEEGSGATFSFALGMPLASRPGERLADRR